MLYVICSIAFLIICGIAVAAIQEPPLDIERMLDALRQVENWDGKSRGAAGERGPWQITPAVWDEFSALPFEWADGTSRAQREEQRGVARRYVIWIRRRAIEAKFPDDPRMIALIWAAGWNAVFYGQPHRPSKEKRAYADRAANLYYDLPKTKEPTPIFKIEDADRPAPTLPTSKRP